LEGIFTWDGPDDWLSNEVAEIKEKELAGATVTPCEENNIPLPQEGIKPPDGPLPGLIQAPVDVEGLLELLLGKAPQCATRHKSQVSVWALGGNELFGEAYGYPLDLLDSYFEASVEGEPNIMVLKA